MNQTHEVERTPIHTRRVECIGYRRSDGLWDIEGRLLDTRSYDMTFYDGRELPAGAPLHQMRLTITLDKDFTIRHAAAMSEHTPYPICPDIAPAYQQLIGLRLGPGFSQKVRELFKGRDGCTHLTELLGPMATTAFQTLTARKHEGPQHNAESGQPGGVGRARLVGRLIDSCHGWRSDGEPIRVQYPEHYTGPKQD
jgi:hypothetical protein